MTVLVAYYLGGGSGRPPRFLEKCLMKIMRLSLVTWFAARTKDVLWVVIFLRVIFMRRIGAVSWRFLLAKAQFIFFFGLSAAVGAQTDVFRVEMGSDYSLARESLVEAIETEGLVVSGNSQFLEMLQRTASVVGDRAPPLLKGEVIQFCSSRLAWAMVEEAPEQLAMCPMAMALYVAKKSPDAVVLSYRTNDGSTQARQAANELAERISSRARALAGLR